ncbi:hypothetical protein [Winogradskyella undariae]|uniref:hypothetical protein n=1 Tax=Winogradskyella undariae TaxID=1285465 RepID=UPI0015C79109|nr:hypothetical protein [Winogradskyella undariae]
MEENNDKKTKKGVVQVIESSLVSIASSFPIAASLASGWSEYKNHKQAERIEQILTDYGHRLQNIEEDVDVDFLASDEAKNLIEQTINKGKDELRDEKRKFLSEFLKNSSTKKLSKDKEKEMILDTIDRISPLQASILKTITEFLVLSRGKANVKLSSDYNPDAKEKPEFGYILESILVQINQTSSSKENIESSLDYMVSIGVIEVASARGWTQVGGKAGVKGFRPTILGLKTLEYLGLSVDKMLDKNDLEKMKTQNGKANNNENSENK